MPGRLGVACDGGCQSVVGGWLSDSILLLGFCGGHLGVVDDFQGLVCGDWLWEVVKGLWGCCQDVLGGFRGLC